MAYSKVAKPSLAWTLLPIVYFLLKEDGDYLLLESGCKIILSGDHWTATWAKGVKLALAYSKVAKPAV